MHKGVTLSSVSTVIFFKFKGRSILQYFKKMLRFVPKNVEHVYIPRISGLLFLFPSHKNRIKLKFLCYIVTGVYLLV